MIPHDERVVHDFGPWHVVTSEHHDGLEFHFLATAVRVEGDDMIVLTGDRDRIIELAGVLFCWLSRNGMTDRNRSHFESIARGVANWREIAAADPSVAAEISAMRKLMQDPGGSDS